MMRNPKHVDRVGFSEKNKNPKSADTRKSQ
jgi:hypothetical protein